MSTVLIAPKSIADLPGPKGWPILGNYLQIDFRELHAQLERWGG